MLIKFLSNGKEINLTSDDIIIESTNFSVDKDGNMSCSNANINGNITSNNANITGGTIKVSGSISESNIEIEGGWLSGNTRNYLYPGAVRMSSTNRTLIDLQILTHNNINQGGLDLWCEGSNDATHVYAQDIRTPILTQTSLESQKKNFEKFENAIDIIKNVDIYKYNLRFEENTDKKHIGFVIGKNYKYSKELTSKENDAVDIYSLASCCLQGIKEQQEIIENQNKNINELQEKIKRLEEK